MTNESQLTDIHYPMAADSAKEPHAYHHDSLEEAQEGLPVDAPTPEEAETDETAQSPEVNDLAEGLAKMLAPETKLTFGVAADNAIFEALQSPAKDLGDPATIPTLQPVSSDIAEGTLVFGVVTAAEVQGGLETLAAGVNLTATEVRERLAGPMTLQSDPPAILLVAGSLFTIETHEQAAEINCSRSAEEGYVSVGDQVRL